MNFIKSIILALMLFIATTNRAAAQSSSQKIDSTKTITVKVKGVNCSMDLKMISANVEKLKGVSSCKPLKMGTTSSFVILFNPEAVTEKEINSTIENTGGCENPNEKPYKVKQ